MKQIFTVNECNMEWLQEYIGKVNKRAVKLGQQEVEYKVVDEHMEKVTQQQLDDMGQKVDSQIKVMIKVFEVEVIAEPIKLGDYRFVALLEHGVSGEKNLVHSMGDVEVPEKYYTAKSICEHCNTNRRRKYTVVLQSESTGEFMQVGKSCLKDFIGYDVENKLKWSDLLDDLTTEVSERGEYFGDKYIPYYNLVEYLSYVEQEINESGYIPRSQCDFGQMPTSERAYQTMAHTKTHKEVKEPIPSQFIFDAIDWIRTKAECKTEYMINLNTICSGDCIRSKDFGFASSLLATYKRYLDKKKKDEIQAKFDGVSEYVGEIGKRQDFTVLVEKITWFETEYGLMYINIMRDANGNIIIWKSSRSVAEEGKQIVLKGTIKEHTEYNGAKQTIVTRCKVLKELEEVEG